MTDHIPAAAKVCLGMPGHGNLTSGASRGFWNASVWQTALDKEIVRLWRPLDVAVTYMQGSLLAQQFNALWAWALNLCHQDHDIRYFAMLHSDVAPEDYWLDKLILELEERELDVLGVAVAIKDGHGMTSTALDRDDRDTWRPLCRLSMTELYRLPETFTSEDVGHRLLLNTGCWVCRFDPKWARQVRFTINDRIVFNRALGVYQAQVESEDWYFSRLCHELGLRIGCTRKIAAEHVGPASFTNGRPWGDAFDAKYVPESILPDREDCGWRFPHDVDGWLTEEEGRALADLASGRNVLEIGSYCGRSTICMAQMAEHVTALDPFDGRGTPRPRDTFDEFLENVERYGVSERVRPLVLAGHDGSQLAAGAFDFVFIDGRHDLESVRTDIDKAIAALKPDGLIAFHDYRTTPGDYDGRWDPGVSEAVSEFVASGAEIIARHGSVAVVRPPQPCLVA